MSESRSLTSCEKKESRRPYHAVTSLAKLSTACASNNNIKIPLLSTTTTTITSTNLVQLVLAQRQQHLFLQDLAVNEEMMTMVADSQAGASALSLVTAQTALSMISKINNTVTCSNVQSRSKASLYIKRGKGSVHPQCWAWPAQSPMTS